MIFRSLLRLQQICDNMNGPREHYAKGNKSERGQITYDVTCM